MTALPATVAHRLIDRLNSLRHKHVDRRGNELDQIRFSVQALRSADYPAFLAVKSMIAALEGNQEEIASLSAELRNVTSSFTDELNLLLSLSISGMRDETVALASELIEGVHDFNLAMQITDCVLSTGKIEEVETVANRFAERHEFDPALFEDVRIVRRLREVGVSEEQFVNFFEASRAALSDLGWPSATMNVTERRNPMFEGCGAFTHFYIGCEGDEAQQVEEQFMDKLIEQGEQLFLNGSVACAITVVAPANE